MNFLPAAVPAERQRCLPGHVCLLPQVATGEGQLAVPMERRCGPNKRRREEENQLNLRWPPGNDTGASVSTERPPPSPTPNPKWDSRKAEFYLSSRHMGANSGPSIKQFWRVGGARWGQDKRWGEERIMGKYFKFTALKYPNLWNQIGFWNDERILDWFSFSIPSFDIPRF